MFFTLNNIDLHCSYIMALRISNTNYAATNMAKYMHAEITIAMHSSYNTNKTIIGLLYSIT